MLVIGEGYQTFMSLNFLTRSVGPMERTSPKICDFHWPFAVKALPACFRGDQDDGTSVTVCFRGSSRFKIQIGYIGYFAGEGEELRQTYSNAPDSRDYAINFFYNHREGVEKAYLACPFLTSLKPFELLREANCQKIFLLVRLCEVTDPKVLRSLRGMEGVHIRYFTERTFHAKFYILGDVALIGSTNLTDGGLFGNRELSISVQSNDPAYQNTVALFDELWESAASLTEGRLDSFETWRKNHKRPDPPPMQGIDAVGPKTGGNIDKPIDAGQLPLERLRSQYEEHFLPAYNLIKKTYQEDGQRHPEFEAYSHEYEIDRFLFWVRGFTTEERLQENPLRSSEGLIRNIRHHKNEWLQVPHEELSIYEHRVERVARLKALFSDEERLLKVEMDEMADVLRGCAAFENALRYEGGEVEHQLEVFKAENSIKTMRAAFHHLAFGQGDYIERINDCIELPEYQIERWGRSSIMELFGWINREGVPPLNGRIIKAMRYLGFDVPT